MLTKLKQKPWLFGILYEALLHIIFWGPVFAGTQSSNPSLGLFSAFLIPLPVWLTLAFPFIHRKMLIAEKGSRFAIGTLICGVVMNIVEVLLILFAGILRPLDWGGMIFYYLWIILFAIAILKWIIALIQSLVYTRSGRRAPSTVSETSNN
jgi:hypothetical protein